MPTPSIPFPINSYNPSNPVTLAAHREGENERDEDRTIFLGNPSNFWRFHPHTSTFDLTRDRNHPHGDDRTFTVKTTTYPVKLSGEGTALVVVDMQNYFLHPQVRDHPRGLAAADVLLKEVLPACHEEGVQVIYLNWGLTEEDLAVMPPSLVRSFMKNRLPPPPSSTSSSDSTAPIPLNPTPSSDLPPPKANTPTGSTTAPPVYVGLGQPLTGITITHPNPDPSAPGSVLMRNSWNADLYSPLKSSFDETQTEEWAAAGGKKVDVVVHKNRLSGMWGEKVLGKGGLEEFLEERGIRTLVFAGVNTDQCVSGTMNDAASKGYDIILLSDCAATSSPAHAKETIEWNLRNSGFLTTGEEFAGGLRGGRGGKMRT